MGLYSYIVTHDTGFAPNPFHGMCTLACCKPGIRRSASVGDLVVGLSSCSQTIVYAMQVDRIIGFTEYWNNSDYRAKRAEHASRQMVERCGDNIYAPAERGAFRQLPSLHSHMDGTEDPESKRRDLGGGRVLVSTKFVYFGGDGPTLPDEFGFLKVGRAYRHRFTEIEEAAIQKWFAAVPKGVHGRPAKWPTGDRTWKPGRCATGASGRHENESQPSGARSTSCSPSTRTSGQSNSDRAREAGVPVVVNSSRCSQS